MTTVSSSQDVNKHSGTTNELENRPEHLNKTNRDQNIVHKLIKSNESSSSSPHAKANKEVKLPNGGNKNEIGNNNNKIPHIHSVELNRTGHVDENKVNLRMVNMPDVLDDLNRMCV